jgi:hypothetical protein
MIAMPYAQKRLEGFAFSNQSSLMRRRIPLEFCHSLTWFRTGKIIDPLRRRYTPLLNNKNYALLHKSRIFSHQGSSDGTVVSGTYSKLITGSDPAKRGEGVSRQPPHPKAGGSDTFKK